MPAKTLDSSITDNAARRFLADAGHRETLWCDRITGLHLLKTKTGGSWRYRYQDATGKRRTATIGRYPAMKPQQAAEKAREWRNEGVDVLADKERARRDAEHAAIEARDRILGTYLDGSYTRHQERKKGGPETLAIIRHNFADYLERDMATLTRADIRQWQHKRESEGRAHSTLQRAFGALKTLLNHATRQDPPVLKENPLERVSLERPSDRERADTLSAERAAARRMLTDDEIQALHAGLSGFADELAAQRRRSRKHGKPYLPDLDGLTYPHWSIPFTYCALYTGMRPGDLYSLTWLELNPNFARLVKIPEKTRHHPDPARITMDLPDDLMAIVKGWWIQQGKPETGLVFPSPITGGQLDKKAHLKAWKRIKRLGGLPDDLTFYALRHHFVSALVAAGVPLLTVAQLAGHKSASMIERNYGHLCPTTARDALNVLSRRVARKVS